MTSKHFVIRTVRSNFPALEQDQVFFDNAGGSQTLGTVIDSISAYLSRNNVQLGATYRIGKVSTARYNAGVAAGARYVNAREDEIVFGASTTQLLRNASFALTFNEGDEIVVSSIDHEANIAPWVDLASRQKLTLKWWTPPKTPNPKLTPSNLAPLLGPRTRLVTCTHATNITGSIHDLPAIAALVHSTNPDALLCVDGVSYAPHRHLDVREFGADIYAFSWYKVYGPHVSMLYASRRAQTHMRSLGHFFKAGVTLEDKIGLAGASYELVQSIPAVLDYLMTSSSGNEAWVEIAQHEQHLASTLLGYLNSKPDAFNVYGETTPDSRVRVPTVAFTVKGWNARGLVEAVEEDTQGKYGFRWGAFYSNRLVYELLGLEEDGVVRVSMVHYNTVDEVKGLIAAIDKLLLAKQ